MQPCQLHGLLWSAQGWDRSLFYQKRHLWNPRLPGEMGGSGEEGRREGERGGGQRLTGTCDMKKNLTSLQKRRAEGNKQGRGGFFYFDRTD